jgi:uncharacterized protein (TIGR00369 family)
VQSQFDSPVGAAPAGAAPRADNVAGRSGLDWLRAAMNGALPPPPLVVELGIRLVQVEKGFVIGEYEVQTRHLNGLDTLHGGVLATLADTAGSCAVLSVVPAGVITPTLEMKINFLRPVSVASGTLRAEGRLISRGRTTGLAEARITDSEGRLVAHATVTCSIVSLDEEPAT